VTSIDLIIGPLYFILIISIAWFLRPLFTDRLSRPYFIPALTLKMIAAICLGLLYQFYYVGEGGDTFGYYYGGKRIWGYFLDSPINAFKVIFWDGDFGGGMYQLVSRIPHYRDPAGFLVDRIVGFIGLFTFGNYSGIALFFALTSFSGSWALYSSLKKLYPDLYKWLAIAILFIPSVVFWGSGILKDTITFSALCWMIWAFTNLTIFKQRRILSILLFLTGFLVLLTIKKYILLVLLPALILWLYRLNITKIRISLIRYSLAPFMLVLMFYSGYLAVLKVGEDDPLYSVDNITNTVYVTAHDIRYWTGRDAGSGYDLGTIPDTWQDMIRLFPAAVNVSLFRPYLWEASNPLMLMLALESLTFMLIVFYLIYRNSWRITRHFSQDPFLIFCLVFSLGFAFAVGISTWNFGTLVRYKLPLMPLFGSMLVVLYGYSKSFKTVNHSQIE
jgi:hypothetical protein